MHSITERIRQTNSTELQELLEIIHQRYSELYPDWQMFAVSVEKSGNAEEQIRRITSVLRQVLGDQP